MGRLYSKVESPKDIGRINCIIRDEMLVVNTPDELSELKKRSDYLCTLTYSPFWQKKFPNIEELREVAIKENRVSVKTANYIAKYKGFNKKYSPWKKEIEVNIDIKPQDVISEIGNTFLKSGVGILEDIREVFCDIRKAMVVCEDVDCLDKLKRGVDIISLLPYIESFKIHFDEGILSAIDSLINKEKQRSVTLANIISSVNGWDRLYEAIGEEEFSKEYLEELLKEEEKAQNYIPTEMKYENGAKVLWISYFHPKRKREYAKRVYLPQNAQNIKIDGVGEFKNRFNNRVWGVKISYELPIKETVIHLRGKEIYLPKRVVKKTKIVPISKEAQDIKITTQRPQSAMDIA